MATVAQRAGIAKGLIYHYFPSKEALFGAVMRASIRPAFDAAERRLAAPGGTAREALADLVALGFSRAAAEPREQALFRLILGEAQRFPELARLYARDVLDPAREVIRRVLRAGAASGEFRPAAADMPGLADLVMAPPIMASVWRITLGEAAPAPTPLQAAHLDILLRGLAPSP
jgi:AcrR family transcriptional regulator